MLARQGRGERESEALGLWASGLIPLTSQAFCAEPSAAGRIPMTEPELTPMLKSMRGSRELGLKLRRVAAAPVARRT